MKYDMDGCFSGSAIETDEGHMLVYTGVTHEENDGKKNEYQNQCVALGDGKSYKMLVDGKLNWQVGFLILNIEDPSLYRYLRLRVYGVVNVHKNNSAMWADGIYEFAAYGKPQ